MHDGTSKKVVVAISGKAICLAANTTESSSCVLQPLTATDTGACDVGPEIHGRQNVCHRRSKNNVARPRNAAIERPVHRYGKNSFGRSSEPTSRLSTKFHLQDTNSHEPLSRALPRQSTHPDGIRVVLPWVRCHLKARRAAFPRALAPAKARSQSIEDDGIAARIEDRCQCTGLSIDTCDGRGV
jgi:hypothetical protein